MYIEVSVLSNISKNLIYKMPENKNISTGMLIFVKVKNNVYPAFVIKIHKTNPTSLKEEKIGEIVDISPYPPFFDEKMLSFYQFASHYYLSSLSKVLTNAFPKLGFYKIKETLETSEESQIFKKEQKVFFGSAKIKSFSYLEDEETSKIAPNDEQVIIINTIKESINHSKYFLLYGKTATGKTALLLLLAKMFFEKEKSVLFMIPEIALAPHIYRRALSIFNKDDILVWHSSLSNAERRYVLNRARDNRCLLIGTRSSVFVPLKDLGLIVIDEEQDHSYKSDTSFPYNSRDLSFVLSKIYKAPLILSSATPSIETYHKVKEGQIILLNLEKRLFQEKKEIIIVDTKISPMVNPFFSKRLIEEIEKNLQKGEQTLLFINRRGYIPYVYCNNCKNFIECRNCTVPLTWHKSKNLLICHHCRSSIKLVKDCPSCGNKELSFFGAGTERLTEMIKDLFPSTMVLTIDRDSTEKKDFFRKHLKALIDGDYKIIVGTQIITKGIHLPKLTLVGIILGEQGLNIPDFRSQERVYQLITQVMGRAGREIKGRVLIQTTNPDSQFLKFAISDDYESFYNYEIESRRLANFPPFTRLLLVKVSGKDQGKAKDLASKVFFELQRHKDKGLTLYPPMEAPIYREKGEYRYQIYVKSEKPKNLIVTIENIKRKIKLPTDIKLIFDIDPYNLL